MLRKLLIFIFIAGILAVRYVSTRPAFKDGDTVRLSGKVVSEPLRYTTTQGINLYGLKAYVPLYPEINYGDRVVLEGTVEEGKLEDAKLVSHDSSDNFIYGIREKLLEVYKKSLPEPHSSLVSGIAIGSKSSLPNDFYRSLKSSGTMHVVVASGMNVTLVAGFLVGSLMHFVSRKKAVPLAIVGIWIYAVIAGFDAPIVRAAIMGSIAFAAQGMGKLYNAVRALTISAVVMLFIKPDWISDLGFILSFVATLSLMLFESKVRRKIYFVPKILREGLSTSLAAQIGVAPILYFSFGQFNLLSPVINALVLWTVPLITIIGMIGGLVGLVVAPLGSLILLLTYPLTAWFIEVVKLFS